MFPWGGGVYALLTGRRALVNEERIMAVDSYKFLPPKLAEIFKEWPMPQASSTPWTPVRRPVSDLRLGFVTTAGVYDARVDKPFDIERERANPFWGDPTYRTIPRDVPRANIGTSHLHINNEPLQEDINTVIALDAAEQAVAEGLIADVAAEHYSVMGYQPDTTEWRRTYVPQMAATFRENAVDVVMLTPV